MSKIIDKFRGYIMGTDYDEENEAYEEYDEVAEEDTYEDRDSGSRDYFNRDVMDITSLRQKRNQDKAERPSAERNGSKIVNFKPNLQMQVVLANPNDVADAASICDCIRENKTVVVNLEGVERANAQRIADFLSGAAYSLQGDIQRISKAIFIVAPGGVQVSGELKEELKSSGLILPWVTSFK